METILIADDESAVRTYVRAILNRAGFQIIEAVDGQDALEKVQRHGAPIDLLLTDVRMPRLDGLSLARSVIELYPGTPVLYISGYPLDIEKERGNRPSYACAFVPKPFTPKLLLEAVEKCLCPPEKAATSTV